MATTTKKKRQRKVDLMFCDVCDSPLIVCSLTNSDTSICDESEVNRRNALYGAPSPPIISPPAPPGGGLLMPSSFTAASLQAITAPSSFTPKPVHLRAYATSVVWPVSTDYSVRVRCCACKKKSLLSISSPDVFKDFMANKFVKVKSPQAVELQFKSFCFADKGKRWSKSQVISTSCVDRNGLPYQFKGESSLKILYGAVQDRWFSTRVCWQKFWSKGKGDLGYQTPLFVQRPKIVDKVILM